jgi:colicin import membrane protein
MLELRIKVLATIYTTVLMSVLVSALFFGGFNFKSPSLKGKIIHATIVDISQLQAQKKAPPKKNKEVKTQVPKEQPKPIDPPKKDPPKKDPPKKVEPKKEPPKIVRNKPKIDTKAQELERKKRQERQKKLKQIRKKRIEVEKRRKKEEQTLKELAAKTNKEQQQTAVVEDIGSKKGQSDADKLNKLMTLYQLAVISSVERQWNKPVSANKNLLCHVKVRQIPGGGVIDATISSPCNANSIVKKSIIAAIKKADPLPYKGFEKVFSRTATFIFEPRD